MRGGLRHRLMSGCGCCTAPARAGGGDLDRRRFLATGAAAGLGAAFAALPRRVEAQAAASARPAIIDVHHHVSPPAFISELVRRKLDERPLMRWSVEQSLEDMDRGGVATAIASITTPGVWFGDDAAAVSLARACNEYATKLAGDHPGRFGTFAILPLPDVDASLREIEYSLDVLKADGVCLMTSYGDKWLGDAAFSPVMNELNRRKAVVYTHPTLADCCRNLIADVPRAVVEFGTDTTRAIASLLFTGTAARCPDIRFIFSHAGGTMPFLIERFVRAPLQNKKLAPKVPDGVLPALRRFHYDVAQAANPAAMSALREVVPVSQIVFGTDFPYRTVADHVKGLRESGFSEEDLRHIFRSNAAELLPRWRAG